MKRQNKDNVEIRISIPRKTYDDLSRMGANLGFKDVQDILKHSAKVVASDVSVQNELVERIAVNADVHNDPDAIEYIHNLEAVVARNQSRLELLPEASEEEQPQQASKKEDAAMKGIDDGGQQRKQPLSPKISKEEHAALVRSVEDDFPEFTSGWDDTAKIVHHVRPNQVKGSWETYESEVMTQYDEVMSKYGVQD